MALTDAERARRYRSRHPDRVREFFLQYRKVHRAELAARARAYYHSGGWILKELNRLSKLRSRTLSQLEHLNAHE